MHHRRLRCASCALLVVLFVAAQPAAAKRLDGVFTAVKDANVVVLDYGAGSYDVRLYGTEAPADGQPFAAEARSFVSDRLLGRNGAIRFKWRNAQAEMVSRIFYTDSQGQERDLAVDMVSAGLAWIRPGAKYPPAEGGEVDDLTAAGAAAQKARRGIWSQADPVAPWTFRGETLPAEVEPSGAALGVAGSLDINVSQRSGADNECAIAKNPTNPRQLVAHCNGRAIVRRSTDGGLTWFDGASVGSYCCDPNLAWDSYGNLYATVINGATNAIVTVISIDGGATFAPLASFSGSVDQPSVVATDLTSGGVALWIVWNQSNAMVARGALVTGLGAGSVGGFTPLQTAPTTSSCNFGDLAVSPGGAVVQVCGNPSGGEGTSNLRVNTDPDGLSPTLGFGASVIATTTNVGGFDFIPAQDSRSVDPEAGLAYDRNPASPHFGRLYLLYTEEVTPEAHDLNIQLMHSDDNGVVWSKSALQINSDATTRSQFLPKIASDPVTGDVAICWHDARNSGSNTAIEVWCDSFTPASYPTLAGNFQVGDGASTSNGAGVEFGDYAGLALDNGRAHPVWADTSNSTGNNPNSTSNFDTYTDRFDLTLFADGFETNSAVRWSASVP